MLNIATDRPLTDWSALDLSRAIHSRQVSCVEVMAAYLDRIERVNPGLNALVSLRPREELLAEAADADAALAHGQDRGWLHGIPQAPKDLSETAGIATVKGSAALRNNIPKSDAIHVERLRNAGAIFIGKTNTPEFGLGSHTYNPVFGTTLNAWDRMRSAGGSSGGAAAALAARLLPVADGSDMMGSLRNPAGWNNIYGFRPSFGRVPRGPAPEMFLQQLSTDGPMARNMADLSMLFATQAGHDPRDPLSLCGDGAEFRDTLAGTLKGKRIGWLGDLGGHLATEPGVLATCEAALALCQAQGCVVEPLAPGFDMNQLWDCWITLRSFLVSGSLGAVYDNPRSREYLKPEAVWEIERGRALSPAQVQAAFTQRSAWYRHVLDLFTRYDFLALPTAQLFPFDAALHWPREIAGRSMDTYHRWMEVVIPASLAGLPALAVPAGFGPTGLPMGLQIMGPPRADRAVLDFGHGYDLIQPFTAQTCAD
ncbi:amidase [Paracoccus laeviglucosivorans]|uniref:Amidase n=1 Tax=Paracoccus laeviglucosivorans TaxID=1197861 RepID=A0A521B113_9RHOB|nr:amidase [Paracoccus laeviglucosivorans]SMO40782.1 amidase [Paracoccus laeviglucosivorans]